SECVNDRVLLRDVNTITLREGQFTTGRRSSPVPQLKCVGGSAKGRFQPRAAQCFKEGFDGVDYQWRCVADLPSDYEFGQALELGLAVLMLVTCEGSTFQVTVTCEGYDYPEDPYILKGSCGLEYDLEYAHSTRTEGKGKSKWSSLSSSWSSRSWWSSWLTLENITNLCIAAFIIYVVYSMLSNSRGPQAPPRPGFRGFGGGFDGGPGFGGGYPGMHPPPSAPPPSYDDTMGFKNAYPAGSAPGTGSGGAGFWTGAGLGALGGYLFGRNTGGSSGIFGSSRGTRPTNERFMRDSGFDDH
ncbi:Store-operated calcium entry-associated regulatory factor, partial [Trichostrongylus colubriformis]